MDSVSNSYFYVFKLGKFYVVDVFNVPPVCLFCIYMNQVRKIKGERSLSQRLYFKIFTYLIIIDRKKYLFVVGLEICYPQHFQSSFSSNKCYTFYFSIISTYLGKKTYQSFYQSISSASFSLSLFRLSACNTLSSFVW